MTFLEAINSGLQTLDCVASAKRDVSPILVEVDAALRAATEERVGLSVHWSENAAQVTILSGRCRVDLTMVRFGPLGWPLRLEPCHPSQVSYAGPVALRQALVSLLADPRTAAAIARAKSACESPLSPFRDNFEG